jgi:hypothetical protein
VIDEMIKVDYKRGDGSAAKNPKPIIQSQKKEAPSEEQYREGLGGKNTEMKTSSGKGVSDRSTIQKTSSGISEEPKDVSTEEQDEDIIGDDKFDEEIDINLDNDQICDKNLNVIDDSNDTDSRVVDNFKVLFLGHYKPNDSNNSKKSKPPQIPQIRLLKALMNIVLKRIVVRFILKILDHVSCKISY